MSMNTLAYIISKLFNFNIRESEYGLIIIILCLTIFVIAYHSIRWIKVKHFKKDFRLNNAKLFDIGVETPILISEKGYLGVLRDKHIINFNDVVEFKLNINDNTIIINNSTHGLFKNICEEFLSKMSETVNSIDFIFISDEKVKYSIRMFNAGEKSYLKFNDSKRDVIVEILKLFENIENELKSRKNGI